MRNILKNSSLAVFILTLAMCVFFPAEGHAANYTRHTFRKTDYDKVWQACIEVRDKYGKGYSKTTGAGKVTFETRSDKEEGIIAFVSGKGIIADTQNTIKLKKYGKTAVMVLIRSVGNLAFFPWGGERDKDTEKKLMREIRDIMEGGGSPT